MVDMFRLWDAVRSHVPAALEFWASDQLVNNPKWVRPFLFAALVVVWGMTDDEAFSRLGSDAVEGELSEEDSDDLLARSSDEFGIVVWYIEHHDWLRILKDLFQITVDRSTGDITVHRGRKDADALRDLLRLEMACGSQPGRQIGDFLAMTPEAYLDFEEAFSANQEQQEEEVEKLLASRGTGGGTGRPTARSSLGDMAKNATAEGAKLFETTYSTAADVTYHLPTYDEDGKFVPPLPPDLSKVWGPKKKTGDSDG